MSHSPGKSDSDADGGRHVLSQEEYRTLFHNAADGLFVHPLDSDEIIAVNDRLTELLGYRREELLDLTVADITADDWTPPVSPTERIRQARENGQVTFEWRDQRKDGTALWVEVTLTVVDLNGVERVLASIRPIEERKRKERRVRAIFDQTYQFTGLLDPDGTLVEANRTALDFGDLDRDDVIGKPLWDCYWCAYSTDVRRQVKGAVRRAASGEFVRQNLEVRGSEGTEIIDFSIRPVTDDRGNVTLLIPEGRVITERLAQNERLAMYNRVMRHNVRNQLTIINGFAGEIEKTTDDPRVADFAERVLAAGTRVNRIAEQIREFDEIRRREASRERVVLADVLAELATEHAQAAEGTTVRTAIDRDLTVRTDPSLVEVVVEQLIENAVEHGGSTVELAGSAAGDRADAGVEIVVRDDGAGIEPAEYEPIVTPTSTPLEHATSIGLLIAKWGVDELGGELRFDSEDGVGTEATVWLPQEL